MLCFQVHIGTSRGLGLMTAVVPQRFVGDSKAAIMVKGVVPGHAAWTDGRVYAGDIICQVAPLPLSFHRAPKSIKPSPQHC